MKNLNLLFSLFFAILLFSCNNEKIDEVVALDAISNSKIQNASMDEKLAYKTTHLKVLANFINDNLSNAELRNKILNFDSSLEDDKTFLIEDLLKIVNVSNEKLASITNSLNAFKNLDGVDWKPCITVYKKRSNSNALQRIVADVPLYFFVERESDVEKTVFPGYESTTAGGPLVEVGNFTEAQTSGRYLIISDITSTDPTDDPYSGPTGGGGTSTPNGVNYNPSLIRMHKMKIKVDKEDWASGDSEVHMVGFITSETPAFSGFCGDFLQGASNCYNADGQRIDKIADRWINNLHEYNYTFQNYSIPGSASGAIMNYVIFENDTWPAPSVTTKQFEFPNGQFRQISYRSWQSPFHDMQLSRFPNTPFQFAGTYVGDNSDIYYIMQGL